MNTNGGFVFAWPTTVVRSLPHFAQRGMGHLLVRGSAGSDEGDAVRSSRAVFVPLRLVLSNARILCAQRLLQIEDGLIRFARCLSISRISLVNWRRWTPESCSSISPTFSTSPADGRSSWQVSSSLGCRPGSGGATAVAASRGTLRARRRDSPGTHRMCHTMPMLRRR